MFEDFLTLETLFTFPIMIIVCWSFVQLTKNLFDKVLNNASTMWIVLVVAFVLTGFKAIYELPSDPLTFTTVAMIIILWIVNAVIVALAAMKAQESFIEK